MEKTSHTITRLDTVVVQRPALTMYVRECVTTNKQCFVVSLTAAAATEILLP
jgi:hypothetical protein